MRLELDDERVAARISTRADGRNRLVLDYPAAEPYRGTVLLSLQALLQRAAGGPWFYEIHQEALREVVSVLCTHFPEVWEDARFDDFRDMLERTYFKVASPLLRQEDKGGHVDDDG